MGRQEDSQVTVAWKPKEVKKKELAGLRNAERLRILKAEASPLSLMTRMSAEISVEEISIKPKQRVSRVGSHGRKCE